MLTPGPQPENILRSNSNFTAFFGHLTVSKSLKGCLLVSFIRFEKIPIKQLLPGGGGLSACINGVDIAHAQTGLSLKLSGDILALII